MTLHPDPIDLAARAMTDVEPPVDLEARIKRRLDNETRTRPTAMRWPVMAGVATAAVTVIIAVTVRSPAVQSPEVPVSRGPEVRGEVPGARGSAVPPPLAASGPESGPRDLGTSGPLDLGTSIRPSDAELAWMSRRIAPLEVIDPLRVPRLQFDSIQPEPLAITPLTMTPLVTSPVNGEPDGGRQP